MEKRKSGVLEPALCAPRMGDKRSEVGVYSVTENTKLVRGEMLYRTSDPRNPAHADKK